MNQNNYFHSEILKDMIVYDLYISLYYLFFIVGSMLYINPFIGSIYFLSFIYMRWLRTYSIKFYNYYLLFGISTYILLSTFIIFKEFNINHNKRLPWL